VPKEFQNNLPNCIIALNMARRIGADPLQVMQNLYVVHGRPGWSATFLIATFNKSGDFSKLRYKWSGTRGKPDWGCQAWAVERATGEKLQGATITMQLANDEGWIARPGSKWKTMPEQMLMYRSAAWFIRAYAPEMAMGLQTTSELDESIVDVPTGEVTRVVVEPSTATPGVVTAADILAGQAKSEDVGDEHGADGATGLVLEPGLGVSQPEGSAPVSSTTPEQERTAVQNRLYDIEREREQRAIKKPIVEHLMRKYLLTADMGKVDWNAETWAKLGRVLNDVRSIAPPAKA